MIFCNDNEPFINECNLFLERTEFPYDINKTKIRFVGNHDGKSIMEWGDINVGISAFREFWKFNNKRLFKDVMLHMFSLWRNQIKINEGTRVSNTHNIDNMIRRNKYLILNSSS